MRSQAQGKNLGVRKKAIVFIVFLFVAVLVLGGANYSDFTLNHSHQHNDDDSDPESEPSPVVFIDNYDDDSIEAIENDSYKVYFGQLHSHTGNSDGIGTYDDAYSSARDLASLDFFAVTDHAEFFDSAGGLIDGGGRKWANMKAAADKYNDDGSFTALAAYEVSWPLYGHINIFNTSGLVSAKNSRYRTVVDGLGPQALFDDLLTDASGSIAQFNHPSPNYGDFHNFAYFTPERDKMVNLIEVCGENIKYYEYYDAALSKGWHLAPTNNQDNHNGGWGIGNHFRTAVMAEALSRQDVYDALSNRRVYATEVTDLEVYFYINGQPMGSILDKPQPSLNIYIRINSPTYEIGQVSIITENGEELWSKDDSDINEDTICLTLNTTFDYKYYYIKIVDSYDSLTLTAPIWVE